MCSYEDSIRAVELFIKLRKRVRATIRQLGYPTKNVLKGWHREFELLSDFPVRHLKIKPETVHGGGSTPTPGRSLCTVTN